MAKQPGKMEDMVEGNELAAIYKNKKVFITGHTGFKGAWLTATLDLFGAVTKGYALEPEYQEGLYNIIQPLNNSSSVIADIRNLFRLALIQQSPKTIVDKRSGLGSLVDCRQIVQPIICVGCAVTINRASH